MAGVPIGCVQLDSVCCSAHLEHVSHLVPLVHHRERNPHPDALARKQQEQEQGKKEGEGGSKAQQDKESRRSKMEAMFRVKQMKQG